MNFSLMSFRVMVPIWEFYSLISRTRRVFSPTQSHILSALTISRFGATIDSGTIRHSCLRHLSGKRSAEIGFECENHLGLHLNVDLYPVRIAEATGQDLPVGRNSEGGALNLVNPATVLLNYRLGDLAAFLPGKCLCGRSLPMLSFHSRTVR